MKIKMKIKNEGKGRKARISEAVIFWAGSFDGQLILRKKMSYSFASWVDHCLSVVTVMGSGTLCGSHVTSLSLFIPWAPSSLSWKIKSVSENFLVPEGDRRCIYWTHNFINCFISNIINNVFPSFIIVS